MIIEASLISAELGIRKEEENGSPHQVLPNALHAIDRNLRSGSRRLSTNEAIDGRTDLHMYMSFSLSVYIQVLKHAKHRH